MSKKDLIPITQRSPEEAFAIRAKGGRGNKGSAKKSLAIKKSWLKRKGMKASDTDWFLKCMDDPTYDIVDIKKTLEDLRTSGVLSDSDMIKLMDTRVKVHKAHFGDKKLNMNINIDIQPDLDIVKAHLKKIIGRDE